MTMNIGGLASGLDTNSIIDQLMQVESQPEVRMKLQQQQAQARSNLLQTISTKFQALRDATSTLSSVATWANVQTVSSSDSTKVTASVTGGAGPGGYQVNVTQLARADQHTYTYTPSSSASQISVGSYSYNVAANATVDDVVAGINSDSASPVYAVDVNGSLVLSARATGTANAFTASSPTLVEDTTKARPALDAQGTVDGVAFTSSTNVVTGAIAGVQLTLAGLTTVTTTGKNAGTTSTPVTVNVSTPGPDQSKLSSALSTFVTAYNDAAKFVRDTTSQQPVRNPQSTADADTGLLFGDWQLTGLMGQLREAVADPVAGQPSAFAQLAQIGISTGATTGGGTINQDSVDGVLTFDATVFNAAMASNPLSVKRLLTGDGTTPGIATNLTTLLNAAVDPGGSLDSRITSATDESTDLGHQIADMDERLLLKKQQLQDQFTAMETALQQSQAQGQWLQGQIGSLG
jgi:flagellar hook-associated protein 2